MKWISIKDKMPEIDQMVLFYFESGNIIQGFIDKDDVDLHFIKRNPLGDIITHWAIPNLPEE